MFRTILSLAISLLAAMALASCGEKTPRSDPEGNRGHSNLMPQHPVHERTLLQSEADRFGA